MLELSLNIEPILTGMDFYDRIACAADLGFKAVEFWDPTVKDASRISRLAGGEQGQHRHVLHEGDLRRHPELRLPAGCPGSRSRRRGR